MNYWVVKGRPSNQWNRYLKPGKRWMWVTRRPSKAWAEGDPVIFWESGGHSRVIGLGEFIQPHCGLTDAGEAKFELRSLTSRLLVTPGIHELRRVPELRDASFLKAADARTVYPISHREGRHLLFKISDQNPSLSRVVTRLLKASGYPSIRRNRENREFIAGQRFSDLFKVGDIVPSAAVPRRKTAADLRIISIEQNRVRFETMGTGHQDVISFTYLQYLLDGFQKLDPKRVQPSVNDVLNSVGWSDYTTETYAFTIATAFMQRQTDLLFLSEGEMLGPEIASLEIRKYFEGRRRPVWVETIERDKKARQGCIDYHGLSCLACGFNFEAAYGPVGIGYIHVHHLEPLSKTRGIREIDYKHDLVPLCPNCHAVAHQRTPPYSVSEVSAMIAGSAKQRAQTKSRRDKSNKC